MRKLDVRVLVREIIRTLGNPIIIVRCTDFLGLDLGVFGRNPNIVICILGVLALWGAFAIIYGAINHKLWP